MPPEFSADASPTERALLILEYVAERRAPVAIREIADELHIPKPTVHRIVATLIGRGYLTRWPGRTVTIAGRLVGLAGAILQSYAESSAVHAVLRDLARRVGESVSIAGAMDGEVVYLHSVGSTAPLALYFGRGQRAPLHCTSSGKVHLAHLSREALETFLSKAPLHAYTPHTVVDPDALRAELQEVRRRGYASSDEEYVAGVVGAAVPITDHHDRLLAALTMAGPVTRHDKATVQQLVSELKAAAASLSELL